MDTTTRPVVIIRDDTASAASSAAKIVMDRIRARSDLVLGLATGRTQVPLYDHLVAAYRAGEVSFAHAVTFNLDEYAGLRRDDPSSFAAYMHQHLFDEVDIDPARVNLPDGAAADLDLEANRYEKAIETAGGVDLQLLGIGANGHIGFNEPGADPVSRTRPVSLSGSTRQANRDFFPDGRVPERAITMGIGTILDAAEIVLLATGPAKAAAVRQALQGPIGPDCPASFLRRHPRVSFVCDREAAAEISYH